MLGRRQIFKKKQIYLIDFNPVKGSVQGGIRPAIIIQNDYRNRNAPTLIVVPITSQFEKSRKQKENIKLYPTEESGLDKKSLILLEQIRVVDKKQCIKYIGKISDRTLQKILEALRKFVI